MKPVYTLLAIVLLIVSCKKEVHDTHTHSFLKTVAVALRDSLSAVDYSALDFSNAVLNKVDSAGLYFVRVPFKGKLLRNDFLIVKTNKEGKIERGKIVHLEGKQNEYGEGKLKPRKFDGQVSISSLDRKQVLNSTIKGGYITAFHSRARALEEYLKDDSLPEVVIVCYVSYSDVYSYSTWLLLNSIFCLTITADPGGGSNGYYYGSLDGNYDNGGGDYSGGTGETNGITGDQTILIDADTYAAKDAIDIDQYLKCFDNIPDAGAQCEIGIYADIPVDSDPGKIFDFSTGSPGHTFIQIKKTSADGNESVIQNIGFYPTTGWKSGLTNAPIDAKFVDDGFHEYNAAYTKNLSPDEFRSALTEIRYLKNMQYDIDNYNCTDWALAVFNKQGYGLDIPLYDVPGNLPSSGTSTPQGVYNKLREMQQNNDVHADKIQVGFFKGYVSYSDGPCN